VQAIVPKQTNLPRLPRQPRQPRQPRRYRLVVDTTLPRISQAVSVWLAVLAFARVERASDLTALPAGLELSDEERALLAAHRDVLPLVGGPRPVISIACCPVCSRWALATSAPGSCRLTIGCTGKPRRAVAAKKQVMDTPLTLVTSTTPSAGQPAGGSAGSLQNSKEEHPDLWGEWGDYQDESDGEDLSDDFPLFT